MRKSEKQELLALVEGLAQSYENGSLSEGVLQDAVAIQPSKKWYLLLDKFKKSIYFDDGSVNEAAGIISFMAYQSVTKHRLGNQSGSSIQKLVQRLQDNKFVLELVEASLQDIFGREKRTNANRFKQDLIGMIRSTKQEIKEVCRGKTAKSNQTVES